MTFEERCKLQDEYNQINEWFVWYDGQIKQYERCKRLNIEFDKDIKKLDDLAEIARLRMREISNILKEDKK